MDTTVEDLKKQHINNYRKAIIENIKNNTNVLVDEDIMSLLRKPPLDSMDYIKVKFLDLAKKNRIVLNTDELSKLLEKYRNSVIKSCDEIKKLRIDELSNIVLNYKLEKHNDIIKINKKDFTALNREIKKYLKKQLLDSFDFYIVKKINSIFIENVDFSIKDKIITDISKYFSGNYQKQLLDNVDIKILVKDTTLINGVKEQAERYLFTLNNSRLFQSDDA